mgnify:CR=1 FL=1
MQDLENNFPKQFTTYHEPFLGGGAVMFNLLTKKPQLSCNVSDFNSDLILAYVTIRDKLEKLKAFENKEIVMGIRPEAFEDGNYANTSEYSESIKVSVSLLEQLGSDSYIHFYKDIKPVQTEAIEEILADDGEDISILGDNTKFIARINPNSTVVEGKEIELKIDPSKLHFFDPETGDAI